jgi:hypothetical protein
MSMDRLCCPLSTIFCHFILKIYRDFTFLCLEWFCVAILRNVTLHTWNIHIQKVKAVNTTIITIMTITNGQQWQQCSILFYKRTTVHKSGKYTAFGHCPTLSLGTVVFYTTLPNNVLICLWLHHCYFNITTFTEWSVCHNLSYDDKQEKEILCKNKFLHDNTQDSLFSCKAKTFLLS